MERKLGTFGLADLFAQKRRKRPNFLNDVDAILKWERVERLLKKKLRRGAANAVGVKAYPALIMFKVLLLQSWFNLSDEEMEFALYDRISFTPFTGFSLDDEPPDHTTICRFRNLLVERKVLHRLLDEINGQLMLQGKLVKTGCSVDASVIPSANHPSKQVTIELVPEDRKEDECPEPTVRISYSKDTDAAWTKKGRHFHYGYKVHAATDTRNGFILAAHVTPANLSDTGEFAKVVDAAQLKDGVRVYADKGYTSKKNSEVLHGRNLKNGIMSKAVRNRPLTEWEHHRNRLISPPRSIIERSFGTLKHLYGLARASYMGIAKVEGEFLLCAMAFKIKKALCIPSS